MAPIQDSEEDEEDDDRDENKLVMNKKVFMNCFPSSNY
jgi:hypothetical protein